jgi:MFS family permease
VQRSARDRAGHISGLVSLGFFAGFVLSPPLFGALSDTAGYPTAWLLVAAQLAGAAIVIAVWQRNRGAAP